MLTMPRKSPRPLYPHKRRLRNRVTIAAGFVCQDGIVLASDTQFTGSVKFSGSKIWQHTDGDLRLLLAAAGDSVLMQIACETVIGSLSARATLADVRKAIESALKTIHEQYVDNSPDPTYTVELLGAATTRDGHALLEHSRFAVGKVDPRRRFSCIGSGGLLGSYLADSLIEVGCSTGTAVLAATHVVQTTKQYDPYCGLGSDIRVMKRDGTIVLESTAEITRLEGFLGRVKATYGPALFGAMDRELASDMRQRRIEALAEVLRSGLWHDVF